MSITNRIPFSKSTNEYHSQHKFENSYEYYIHTDQAEEEEQLLRDILLNSRVSLSPIALSDVFTSSGKSSKQRKGCFHNEARSTIKTSIGQKLVSSSQNATVVNTKFANFMANHKKSSNKIEIPSYAAAQKDTMKEKICLDGDNISEHSTTTSRETSCSDYTNNTCESKYTTTNTNTTASKRRGSAALIHLETAPLTHHSPRSIEETPTRRNSMSSDEYASDFDILDEDEDTTDRESLFRTNLIVADYQKWERLFLATKKSTQVNVFAYFHTAMNDTTVEGGGGGDGDGRMSSPTSRDSLFQFWRNLDLSTSSASRVK